MLRCFNRESFSTVAASITEPSLKRQKGAVLPFGLVNTIEGICSSAQPLGGTVLIFDLNFDLLDLC